jgi:hypothetical protein
MRILVSQFRCPKCKAPIKTILVEQCPKCGVRLTINNASKFLKLTILMLPIAFVIAGFYLIMSGEDPYIIIASLIVTGIIFGGILGYFLIKTKKRMKRDNERIGSLMVELERHPVYTDIKLEKKYLLIPLVSIGFVIIIIIISIVDLFFTDFLSIDQVVPIVIMGAILVIIFGISTVYAYYKFNKKAREEFDGN